MDDLTTMLSQVLSDPESMQKISSMAASLGFTGDSAAPPPASTSLPVPVTPVPTGLENVDLSALSALLGNLGNTQQQPAPPVAPAASGGVDLSALSALLGNLGGTQQPNPAPASGSVDLSALSGLLGNLGIAQPKPTTGGADVSALTALLGGAPQGASGGGSGLPFDMGTLLKLQQAMSSLSSNKANVDLLLALKPRLKEDRAKKVDDAIRVMQLIQFLPLIKETGLFGDMDNILGGKGGGLGGIVSGLGDGLGGILSSLGGGGGGGIGGILGNLLGGSR